VPDRRLSSVQSQGVNFLIADDENADSQISQ
jgi:hypothetical protein